MAVVVKKFAVLLITRLGQGQLFHCFGALFRQLGHHFLLPSIARIVVFQ